MESAQQDLVIMVRLQGVYDRIGLALGDRSVPPEDVQHLQEENDRRLQELDAMERQVEEHNEELREVRRKEEESQLELEHFQRQKAQVTNEREFTAVISEIDFATRARDEAAARRAELEELITNLTVDIEARRKARPEEEAAQNEVVTAWEERKTELKKVVHDLALEAKDLESQLQPSNRARFLRLLESKKGTAMARVIEGSCSLCHFELRPHLQQRVRRMQEIIDCETCHRVLYFSDMDGLTAAEDAQP